MSSDWRRASGPVAFFFVGAVPAAAALTRGADVWSIGVTVGVLAMGAGFLAFHLALSRQASDGERRLEAVSGQVARLEAQARERERDLEEARSLDEVTGVLNRRTFLRRFDETVQRDGRIGKPFAFLLLDVDGFRAINERIGRLQGDELLLQVARTVQAATRGTDAVGRLGGDEFGVTLGECEDPGPAVDRILVSLSTLRVPGSDDPVRVSIGAVWIESALDGADFVEVFRAAEAAWGSVRGKGGGLCGRRNIPKRSGGPSVYA
ncbi:MAG TPA: GGDEF domain-containing protein [Candidatus Polarisedimenticolaceae bacterium]